MIGLRAFHLIFIAASAALSFGFAGWAGARHGVSGRFEDAAMGGASLGLGIVLLVYGVWFIRKTAKGKK